GEREDLGYRRARRMGRYFRPSPTNLLGATEEDEGVELLIETAVYGFDASLRPRLKSLIDASAFPTSEVLSGLEQARRLLRYRDHFAKGALGGDDLKFLGSMDEWILQLGWLSPDPGERHGAIGEGQRLMKEVQRIIPSTRVQNLQRERELARARSRAR